MLIGEGIKNSPPQKKTPHRQQYGDYQRGRGGGRWTGGINGDGRRRGAVNTQYNIQMTC